MNVCGGRLLCFVFGNFEERSMASSSSNLPKELVIEILSRLPVKSLLRFKCVCKFWCDLFEKPSFVSKQNSSNNTLEATKIIVDYCLYGEYALNDFLWLSNETLEASKVLELTYLRVDHRSENLHVLDSSYGVICLRDSRTDHLVLWNPSTRQSSKVVPKSHESMIHEKEFGFGYDVKTNDFKVVRFLKLRKDDVEKRAEVYSLSTNSWRLVDAVAPHLMYSNDGWRSLNGILFRLSDASKLDCETDQNQLLISFDMRDELFLLTPLPKHCSRTNKRNITVLNEFVTLIQIPLGHFLKIWVLNEYGSKGSWTKLYTIVLIPRLSFPFGFWKNSKLFMETENGELVVCDLINREIKKLQVDEKLRVLGLFPYKESLVPIKGGENNLSKRKGG